MISLPGRPVPRMTPRWIPLSKRTFPYQEIESAQKFADDDDWENAHQKLEAFLQNPDFNSIDGVLRAIVLNDAAVAAYRSGKYFEARRLIPRAMDAIWSEKAPEIQMVIERNKDSLI